MFQVHGQRRKGILYYSYVYRHTSTCTHMSMHINSFPPFHRHQNNRHAGHTQGAEDFNTLLLTRRPHARSRSFQYAICVPSMIYNCYTLFYVCYISSLSLALHQAGQALGRAVRGCGKGVEVAVEGIGRCGIAGGRLWLAASVPRLAVNSWPLPRVIKLAPTDNQSVMKL
jgi:hypothetical protein